MEIKRWTQQRQYLIKLDLHREKVFDKKEHSFKHWKKTLPFWTEAISLPRNCYQEKGKGENYDSDQKSSL